MRTARLALIPAVLLAFVACRDDRNAGLTGLDAAGGTPNGVIWDGSRAGNPDFFFLPPLLPNPSGEDEYDADGFNGNWKPVVRICRLTSTPPIQCESQNGAPVYLATYQGAAVTVSLADEHYAVNVNTRESWATTGTYRVHVFLPRTEPLLVGYVDVVLVADQAAFRNVNSTELVPLMDGRTLPLKFRIEDGVSINGSGDAVEVLVTDAGGTFTTSSGDAGITLGDGWLPAGLDNVMLTIERVPTGVTNDCHFGALPPWVRQYENCIRIETSPTVGIIQADAVVGMCTEAPTVAGQVMYKSDPLPAGGRRVKALPNEPMPTELSTALSCGDFVPTAPPPPGPIGFGDWMRNGAIRLANGIGRVISPRPAYAIDFGEGGHLRAMIDDLSSFGWGVPAHVHIAAGDEQTGEPGSLLPDTLIVRVTATHAHNATSPDPIANVPVTFAVTTGGGSLYTFAATTDALGYARAFWTLGSAAGPQTVTATIPSDSTNNVAEFPPERSVTFTANPTGGVVFTDDGDVITSEELFVGESNDLDATLPATTAAPICTWTSSNTSVFTVSGTGVVTGISAGSGTLTATCNSVPGSIPITVLPPPDGIVVLSDGEGVPSTNADTVFFSPFTTSPTHTYTTIPYTGGVPVPSPSCTYTLTNPPSANPMSISGQTATTVTINFVTSTPAGQPTQLAITCGSYTRTIAVTAFPIPG